MDAFSEDERQVLLDKKMVQLLHKFATILASTEEKKKKGNNGKNETSARNEAQNDGQLRRSARFALKTPNASTIISNNLSAHHLLLSENATYPAYLAMNLIYSNTVKNSSSAKKKVIEDNDTPTVSKALQMKDRDKWIAALNDEVNSLLKETLIKVDIRDFIRNTYIVIQTTTQLKRKRNARTNEIEKYKARICARGDMLTGILTTEETYSPTINPLTFALILQLAVIFKMKKKTVDTVSAYLYQQYPTHVRTILTKLEENVAEALGLDPQQHYLIQRYLYGLPDAGKAYYEAYSQLLMNNGYKRSAMDPCLFYKINQEEATFIVIHVDDTFIFSTNDAGINTFLNVLQSQFDITINDDADSYLGVHFDEDPVTGNITLRQPKLLATILKDFLPLVTNPPATITTTEYQQLLGTLMYLTKSRPDIQTAISFAATHAQNPTTEHYKSLLNVVAYIEKTQDHGLIIKRYQYKNGEPLQLYCHVDASYLTHEDSKSHTGYTLSFGQIGTFFSKSSKQTLVSTSSTHAEARALYSLLQDIIYVLCICQELDVNIQLPVQVFEDNFPVVQLTNNLAPKAKKCKHFLMLINFIKEKIEQGIINVQHIDTNENIADVLTKLLTGFPFQSKADKLLGRDNDFESKYKRTKREDK